MAVCTKAILRKGTTIEKIENAISLKYTNVRVISSTPDFMHVIFDDGNEGEQQRSISVHFNGNYKDIYGIDGVWISLGKWGNSVEIVKYLCETFGGYIDEDDCDDIGFYPINFHLYSQGSEFTKMDELRHKIINEVGTEKVNKIIKLFEEYSEIANN